MDYTVKQYIEELEKRKNEVDKLKVIKSAAESVHGLMVVRIFDDGLNCRNQPHGEYSTKSLYVNTSKNSPKSVSPVGKTGKSTFANGNSHKSTYFANGYKEFKQKIGRGDKVNFRLWNDLQLDFANSLQPNKTNWISGTKRKSNSNKVVHLSEKYGQCSFKLTEKEKEQYNLIIGKNMTNLMQGNA